MLIEPDAPRDSGPTPSPAAPRASSSLLSAALVGLLGVSLAAACSSDEGSGRIDSNGGGGSGGDSQLHGESGHTGGQTPSSADAGDEIYSRVISTDEISFGDFSDLCEKRGGFVTTSAHCAGSNLCKGLSYATDGTTLSDHSCKGLSSCMGMSCVDLPKDSGLSGQELYEAGPCAGCHNDALKGASTYVVFVRPGTSSADALSRFDASSDAKLMSIVAFGTQGVNDDGTQYSNMPSYREQYSRAEMSRVVEYLRTLAHPTAEYEIPTR